MYETQDKISCVFKLRDILLFTAPSLAPEVVLHVHQQRLSHSSSHQDPLALESGAEVPRDPAHSPHPCEPSTMFADREADSRCPPEVPGGRLSRGTFTWFQVLSK